MKKGLGAAWAKFKNVSEEETINLAGEKIIRDWQARIRTAEKNIASAKIAHEESLIEIAQELKEKKQAYLDSYLDINQADVASVEKRKSFVSKYEQNIAEKQSILDDYEHSIAYREAEFNYYLDSQEAIIEEYKERISILEGLMSQE